ncbi:MAG: Na/Pi symporter [Porticoccaceae bacterium]|nr:Na/Pi cotransporter family protein [Pseudomonadales bacterium]MCP5173448.1 Na/Pi cotransporter family protein [Pseudomonadales bacterium]MCP5303261.1 Na/Pi cotransporter family protein [Pseudomonadales bacterium]
MENIHILMAGLTAIILFVFGLEHFSKEIERITGEQFRKSISKATRLPIIGVVIGALVTAVIQSSSATSVITISLVNAGVLSFKNSVGIIFGANIGTTITAQLVAFKLTAFAPAFIILGFFLSLLRSRYSVFGKAVFYFGFVFFSLNLIASSLEPLQNNPALIELLTQPQNPLLAILIGCLFTSVVQSSSVTTGLAIIFTQQGILGLENAVPLIMGANIGTTATALIAMFNMDAAAKKTALSHFLFNAGGVLLFLPVLLLYGNRLSTLHMEPAIALANIHLVFNVVTSVIFILLVTPFTRLVDWIMGEGKMDFERLKLPVMNDEETFDTIKDNLNDQSHQLLKFLEENYNLVTLSLETNYRGIYEAAGKRLEYTDFVKKEYMSYFSKLATQTHGMENTREFTRLINQFDYLFQIHDSIDDLHHTKKVISEHYVELKSDVLLIIRELSSQTLALFDDLSKGLSGERTLDINALSKTMQDHLNDSHKAFLALMADPQRKDAGALTNFITYSQRLKDKLINYANIKNQTA